MERGHSDRQWRLSNGEPFGFGRDFGKVYVAARKQRSADKVEQKFSFIIYTLLWDNLGPTKKEDGVTFQSPIDGQQMMLTPERSIQIQNGIGADIIMALDDVVSSVHHESSRFEEATRRTLRWIDRCVAAHRRPSEQALFGIIQGGLDQTLRDVCVEGAVLDFNLSK